MRLPHPGRKPFPEWWLRLTLEERRQKRATLPPEDLREVEEAVTSASWLYRFEEELRQLLEEAVREIIAKGIPYLEEVSEVLNHPDRKRVITELKRRIAP